MRTYRVQIEGVAPLRMNKFNPEVLKEKSAKKTEQEYQELAETRTYKNENGEYIVPGKALKACIVNGGAKVSMGRGKAKAILKAVLFTDDTKIDFKKSDRVLVTDNVRVPPRTGAMVMQYWIAFKNWSCSPVITVTDDTVPESVIKNSIAAGGLYNGLLDGRPDLGRFVLKEIKEI